jgi:phage terminase small subunit
MTEQQEKFLDLYINTGNATKAAKYAGYGSPKQRGWELKKRYQKEIEARQKAMIMDSVPSVIANIIALANGADSEAVRLNACKDLMDRAGFKPVEKTETEITTTEQKSTEELTAELAELQKMLQ